MENYVEDFMSIKVEMRTERGSELKALIICKTTFEICPSCIIAFNYDEMHTFSDYF